MRHVHASDPLTRACRENAAIDRSSAPRDLGSIIGRTDPEERGACACEVNALAEGGFKTFPERRQAGKRSARHLLEVIHKFVLAKRSGSSASEGPRGARRKNRQGIEGSE